MRSMMKRLKCYLDKKRLTLNTRKTKVMRFRKRGGRMKNAEWKWKDERIEEVVEFEYLGYTLQSDGGQEAQVRERVRRVAAVMRRVWEVGKRRFQKDWKRRMWLFYRLVWSGMSYGIEIWGWRKREKIEGI